MAGRVWGSWAGSPWRGSGAEAAGPPAEWFFKKYHALPIGTSLAFSLLSSLNMFSYL